MRELAKEQNRAFIKGRQIRLDADRLLLVEKTKPSISCLLEVGWRNRVGKVTFRTGMAALRGSTILMDVIKERVKAYSVAVPLEGTEFAMESNFTIQLRTADGIPYMWFKCTDDEQLKRWLVGLNIATKSEVCFKNFEILHAVGKGGMGKVFLAKHRRTGERLALKVIDKRSVFDREGHLQHMVDERLLLEMGSDHPFVLKLKYAFQTESNFFLATEFCEGGDLYHLLKRRRKTLNEDSARMITSEVILALESMHTKGCVYRDLKPDNVLLDSEGHVRLADFGLAKLLKGDSDGYERTNSFCGTAQYTPPEMVQKRYYTQSVDLWCLGVFLYEVIEGCTPFYTRERERMYKRIEREDVKFTPRFSEEARDLIEHLLEKNPRYRYTLKEVKAHPFYESVDWERVKKKEFWSRGIYTAKERREVAMEELRIINTERYRNLTVNEDDEVKRRGLLRVKKQPTLVVPGFNYTSPEITEDEKKMNASSSSGSANDPEETARRIMESATQLRHRRSFRSASFRNRSSRADSFAPSNSMSESHNILRTNSTKERPSGARRSGLIGRRIRSVRGASWRSRPNPAAAHVRGEDYLAQGVAM
mmetsp:Transcript_73/g.202  ORF Transcript_73/g.202 Transcript_73/m.202 type:complete len:592 (-) Transcript_73:1331-3106(-)|eukprot:CAMPEP_0198723608 /NCGR_PEP_ID=MMETSP1475-20131203/1132_1 /TAXON_ID= ORGANISM="Unidentified sp., Strain CCMP1999" /NCGR_SAMPLE_ID=MMETSP1475 /ASSEMBLY_ACC=CAM_ASM_001111 /LENGTH=591 /DNA_ID=CAMNT_0044484823 /DNA_START=370 /DNA_END=2145 /DNA_ORIENTATION=+